jgi:LytS/YehU family sensor histidine kinase
VGVEGPPEPPRRRGLSTRSKVLAGLFIAVLYAGGMSARGYVVAGIVGGVLGGIVCFLALREYERQRGRG